MTIKNLVLCGGGPVGLVQYGILKNLSKKNIINYNNINSIYATSIGGLVALIYMLNFEWSWMDDFIIKRPWQKLIQLTHYDYLNLFYSKGLLDVDLIIKGIKPLLDAKNISIDVTLKEFYEIINIKLNLFTTDINNFCKVCLNYLTFPNLKLYEALYMTSTIPILFKPLYIDNVYYLDGGIFINCPIMDCIINEKCKNEELLVISNDKRENLIENDISNCYLNNNNNNNNNLNEDSNLFDYLLYILRTFINKIMLIENNNTIEVKYCINAAYNVVNIDLTSWINIFNDNKEKEKLIDFGINISNTFIEKFFINNNDLTNLDKNLTNLDKNLTNLDNDLSNNNQEVNTQIFDTTFLHTI